VRFQNSKYVGDPLNAVRIFNEKEVDELMVIDIDATVNGSEPNYPLIERMAKECRMPLCYGGGIKTPDQAYKIFSYGVEKIAISSIAIEKPEIITAMAKRVGNQSVVVVVDAKKKILSGKYEVLTYNATKRTGVDPVEFARRSEEMGAGEIVVNSIDNDGVMKGYDLKLIDSIRNVISIPMTAVGGAGSLDDIGLLINHFGIIGAAAGSVFVFKGKYRAVLINYPNHQEKNDLIDKYFIK
jgi:cyclase